jgi:hypothetical protein
MHRHCHYTAQKNKKRITINNKANTNSFIPILFGVSIICPLFPLYKQVATQQPKHTPPPPPPPQ